MSKKRKALIWSVCAVLFIAFIISPLAAQLRSMAIMSVYSGSEEKSSLQSDLGFEIEIPSGKGWYPFVMTFNADESFEWLLDEKGARLTIMYNFPAFFLFKGCSRLFDEDSDLYNSFYGAYLTSLPDGGSYGFEQGGIDLSEAVASIAWLDFFGLVLGDFGLRADERVFDYSVISETAGVSFLGYEGWTRVNARLRVNGAAHEAVPGARSYLQYGKPRFPVTEPFAPVDMECSVVARYFEEWNTTVYFYVMTSSRELHDQCLNEILPRSVIRAN